MMTKQLTESLNHLDMENQLIPIVTIDYFRSKIGNDSDFVTLGFTVKSKGASEDLVVWFERGYDFVIDAENSPGEISPGKYLVFVELSRRSKVPAQIIEMLSDLDTLTGCSLEDWQLKIGDKMYEATENDIKKRVKLSPLEYKEAEQPEDADLNEMRVIAGLEPVTSYDQSDDSLKSIQNLAGIY
jgi:hypothetical protein